jgi:hypothetical protein
MLHSSCPVSRGRLAAAVLAAAVLLSAVGPPFYGAVGSPHSQVMPTQTATPVPRIVPSNLSSSIRLQNLDRSNQAQVELSFFRIDRDDPPVSLAVPAIPPGGVAEIDLNDSQELANGPYSAAVSSSAQIGAVQRTQWTPREDVSMYSSPETAPELIVPWFTKRADGYKSVLFLQNSDPSAVAIADVELIPYGIFTPTAKVRRTIPAHKSAAVDPVADGDLVLLPESFVGWVRIQSTAALAGIAVVENEQSVRSVLTYSAVPSTTVASKLYAPLIHRRWPVDETGEQQLSSAVVLFNSSTITSTIEVTYHGVGGSCAGSIYSQGPFELVPAGRLHLQHADWPPGDPPSPLPGESCTYSAVIAFEGGSVSALVTSGLTWDRGAAVSSAYVARPAEISGPIIALPSVRRGLQPDRSGLSTGLQVQNVGEDDANVVLELYDEEGNPVEGCGDDCVASIAPGVAYLWWPPDIAAVPEDWDGSAWITSDQPVSAAAYEVATTGALDMGIFRGLPARETTSLPGQSLAPYLAKRSSWTARRIQPSPTPSPTSTPTPTATPTPGPNYLPFAATE